MPESQQNTNDKLTSVLIYILIAVLAFISLLRLPFLIKAIKDSEIILIFVSLFIIIVPIILAYYIYKKSITAFLVTFLFSLNGIRDLIRLKFDLSFIIQSIIIMLGVILPLIILTRIKELKFLKAINDEIKEQKFLKSYCKVVLIIGTIAISIYTLIFFIYTKEFASIYYLIILGLITLIILTIYSIFIDSYILYVILNIICLTEIMLVVYFADIHKVDIPILANILVILIPLFLVIFAVSLGIFVPLKPFFNQKKKN